MIELENQARILCTVVVQCENKLMPFLDETATRAMSIVELERVQAELQEMMFDCRQFMEKINNEKNYLLELINALEIDIEQKEYLAKPIFKYWIGANIYS